MGQLIKKGDFPSREEFEDLKSRTGGLSNNVYVMAGGPGFISATSIQDKIKVSVTCTEPQRIMFKMWEDGQELNSSTKTFDSIETGEHEILFFKEGTKFKEGTNYNVQIISKDGIEGKILTVKTQISDDILCFTATRLRASVQTESGTNSTGSAEVFERAWTFPGVYIENYVTTGELEYYTPAKSGTVLIANGGWVSLYPCNAVWWT